MRERDEIKQVYAKMLTILRENTLEELHKICDKEVKFHFSTIGECQSIEEFKQKYAWNQTNIHVRRVKTSNIVIRHDEKNAVLSAYALFLYGRDNGNTLYAFEFGGKFLLRLHKNKNWYIRDISFDLDWEKGNTSFVPAWILTDYTRFAGHSLCIVSEFDSPWAVMKDEQILDDRTEDEKCQELFAQYAWGVDQADWQLLLSTWDEQIVSIMPRGNLNGPREFLMDIKKTRFKEATMQHACRIFDIEIKKDTAYMKGWRMEPHRLGSKFLHRGNVDQTFYSARYDFKLKKVGTTWKFIEILYQGGVFFEAEDRKQIFTD